MRKKYLLGVLLILSMCLFIIPSRASEIELKTIEDAYVNSFYSNDNYGASDYLYIGTDWFLGTDVSYLKYDIPESNKVILSATIKTLWYNYGLETRLQLTVATTTNAWDENTITWDNAPYFYYDIIDSKLIGNAEWFNFDVLDYITNGEILSIIIWEDGDSGEWLQSDSKECDFLEDPAILLIVYETTIEDFIPFILIGVAIGLTGVIGLLVYLKRKKKRESNQKNAKSKSP